MIFDSPEIYMEAETVLEISGEKVELYHPDYEGFEQGKRFLRIPDGIESVGAAAFSEYNGSEAAASVFQSLAKPQSRQNEWEKILRRKQMIKIRFPEEAGSTVSEKAAFMAEKERRVRMLKLELPASIREVPAGAFPDLLEEICIDEANTQFSCREGSLFSKDGKRLIRYPGYRNEACCSLPEGVEVIETGAFRNAFLKTLKLPDSLVEIRPGAFVNTAVEELVFGESLEEIRPDTFSCCEIKKMVLPAALKKIGDRAFFGMSGLKALECESETVEVGTGIFSKGQFEYIEWWPWAVIPKGTFINSSIREICVPDGVESVEEYAFAGCRDTKKIMIPESTVHIGKHSFDEGYSFSADVAMPKELYHFAYRFPAMSKINGLQKSEAWRQRDCTDFTEDADVLLQQKQNLQKYMDSLNFLQGGKKSSIKKELQSVEELLKSFK